MCDTEHTFFYKPALGKAVMILEATGSWLVGRGDHLHIVARAWRGCGVPLSGFDIKQPPR